MQTLKNDAYAAGALDVLTKPVKASELRVKLRLLSAEAARRRHTAWNADVLPDWHALQVRILGRTDGRRSQRVAAYASIVGQRMALTAKNLTSAPASANTSSWLPQQSDSTPCTPDGRAAPCADRGHAGGVLSEQPGLSLSAEVIRIADDFDRITALAGDEAVRLVLRADTAIRSRLGRPYASSVVDAFNSVLPQLAAIHRQHRAGIAAARLGSAAARNEKHALP